MTPIRVPAIGAARSLGVLIVATALAGCAGAATTAPSPTPVASPTPTASTSAPGAGPTATPMPTLRTAFDLPPYDPRRFPDPDLFDVAREDTGHLTFGGGVHFCIGAPLARMELEVTLGELAATQDELELISPAVRRPTFQFRGYERLEVALHRRPGHAPASATR